MFLMSWKLLNLSVFKPVLNILKLALQFERYSIKHRTRIRHSESKIPFTSFGFFIEYFGYRRNFVPVLSDIITISKHFHNIFHEQ